jgi:hypothetical protein
MRIGRARILALALVGTAALGCSDDDPDATNCDYPGVASADVAGADGSTSNGPEVCRNLASNIYQHSMDWSFVFGYRLAELREPKRCIVL